MKPQKKLTKQDLKTDEFVTFTTNAILFATARKYQILAVLAIILVMVFGGLTGIYIKRLYDQRASEQLSAALRLYNPDEQSPEQQIDSKVLSEASAKFQSIYNDFSRSKVASQALFYHAATLLTQNRTDEAIASLELFLERFPLHPFQQNVRMLMISALMSRGDYQKSLTLIDKLALEQKETSELSMTLLYQGICMYQLARYDEARQIFQRITVEFENSPWAQEAKDYMLMVPVEETATGDRSLASEDRKSSQDATIALEDPSLTTIKAEELTRDVKVLEEDNTGEPPVGTSTGNE